MRFEKFDFFAAIKLVKSERDLLMKRKAREMKCNAGSKQLGFLIRLNFFHPKFIKNSLKKVHN